MLGVDNVVSATKGLIMSNAILEALRYGHHNIPGSSTSRVDTDIVTSFSGATFIVGHDGDLDRVATALGARWILDSPYLSSDSLEYVPTPPGSAMHFEYDLDLHSVQLSYLYPVFPMANETTDNNIQMYGAKFNIEKTPLILLNDTNMDFNSLTISIENQATSITPLTKKSRKHIVLDELQKRLEDTLKKYPEAQECYDASVSYYNRNRHVQAKRGALVVFVMCIVIFALFYRGKKMRKTRRGSNGADHTPDSEIL